MPQTIIDSSPLRFNDGDAIYFGNDVVTPGSYAKLGLNSARFDVDLPSTGMKILPYQNDAGVVQIGDGTTDMDVKIFLGDTSHYVLFDVALQQLIIFGCDIALSGDLTVTVEDISIEQGKYLYFEGQGSATYIRAANAGYLDLDAATAIRLGADLFLESGGVINWNNGNQTITHDNATTSMTITGKIWFGGVTDWGAGATGTVINGDGYDVVTQTIGRVNANLNNTAAAAHYAAMSITANQTGSNSIFGHWVELYVSNSVSLAGSDNYAAIWGQFEAGTSVTLSDAGNFTAGGYFNVKAGSTLTLATGHTLNGVRAQIEVSAITLNGTAKTAAFECLKSGGVDWNYGLYVDDVTTGICIAAGTTTAIEIATGGVISFDSGNVTITHSSNLLTISKGLTVTGASTFSDDMDIADGKKITFRAATEHIISDAASEIMVTAATIVNLAIGGTDVLRVEAAKISLLQDIFTDRWASLDTNVYIGIDVCGGEAITTAHDNVVIGHQAGYSLTTADETVIIGAQANYNGTTQGNNVVIGYKAFYLATYDYDTVAIGAGTLDTVADGNTGNTAVGTGAGSNVTTGGNNVFIGNKAGSSADMTTADDCIFIGQRTYPASTATNGYIQIGRYATRAALLSDNDGDWEIKAMSGKQIDLRIGSTDELTVSATQVLIPTNDLLVQAGSLSVAHATLGADERLASITGVVATPAMTDGYGAVEVDLAVTGAISGAAFAASTWINLGASVTVSGGQNIGPHTDGIYIDDSANLSSAILALCGRFSLIAGTNVSWNAAHLFDLNLDIDKDLTSLFNVNDLAKVGYVTGDHSSAIVGSIPLIGEGGSVKWVRVHDTPA